MGVNVMRSIRSSALVPRGFIMENLSIQETGAVMTVRSAAGASHCPACGLRVARRISRTVFSALSGFVSCFRLIFAPYVATMSQKHSPAQFNNFVQLVLTGYDLGRASMSQPFVLPDRTSEQTASASFRRSSRSRSQARGAQRASASTRLRRPRQRIRQSAATRAR